MPHAPRKLPPLQSFVYFESAARHLNFTSAALELGATQPAVSQRVRAMEDELGVSLFQRLHRGVRLTAEGERLYQAVSDSLGVLRDATAEVRAQKAQRTLTLATDFGFARLWLMPRMNELREALPELRLRLITAQHDLDPRGSEADLRIVFDHEPLADATLLFPERVVPVCSPALLKRHRPYLRAAELAALPLLQLQQPAPGPARWMNWAEWFGAQGLPGSDPEPALSFNDYTMVVQAAADGLGAALGWAPLVDELLERGDLVIAHDRPVQTARGYYLMTSRPQQRHGLVERFRDWLLQACARTRLPDLLAGVGPSAASRPTPHRPALRQPELHAPISF